jgi:hypothetical protein
LGNVTSIQARIKGKNKLFLCQAGAFINQRVAK